MTFPAVPGPHSQAPKASVTLVTADDIARSYDFGPGHPLRPERVLRTYEAIAALGLDALPGVSKVPSRSATDAEIAGAHSEEYMDVVKGLDAGTISAASAASYGLGTGDNPIFKGMHPAAAAVCGASITAAEAVATGRSATAFNPAGGLHHARRSEASGFCIYNDPAVAIAKILELQPGWRVMYVDVDVHHGDGVQWIFYEDPRVLTVSLHQSGRYLYPGTGFEDEIGAGDAKGTCANVPFLPYAGDGDYLWALRALLFPLAEAFSPDVVVTQLGADTHHGDPLANLGLTMRAYPAMARILKEVVQRFGSGRWVATGGGGYQSETVVPKVWTIHFAEMCGATRSIPESWLEDEASHDVSRDQRAHLEGVVGRVLDSCLPPFPG